MKEFSVTVLFRDTSYRCKVSEINSDYAKAVAWNKAMAQGFNQTPTGYIVKEMEQ